MSLSQEDNQACLKRYFEAHADALHYAIRQTVMRSGIPLEDAVQIASEVLNEVVVEALAHAGRLQTPEQPFAWLMGIALNLVRRRLAEHSRRVRREPLLHDLYPVEMLTEEEVIDRFIGVSAGVDQTPSEIEASEQAIARVLAQVSSADQEVVRLAVLNDLSGEALAKALGTTPGAARLRLHRALKRLRLFWGTKAKASEDISL